MTASTSKYTDKVLQNVKEVNNKVIEADLDIENRIRSVIENKIFSKNAIEKWKKYYVDTGTQLVLVPMGTYLRQTSSTDNFVVIDIYGRILESDC